MGSCRDFKKASRTWAKRCKCASHHYLLQEELHLPCAESPWAAASQLASHSEFLTAMKMQAAVHPFERTPSQPHQKYPCSQRLLHTDEHSAVPPAECNLLNLGTLLGWSECFFMGSDVHRLRGVRRRLRVRRCDRQSEILCTPRCNKRSAGAHCLNEWAVRLLYHSANI